MCLWPALGRTEGGSQTRPTIFPLSLLASSLRFAPWHFGVKLRRHAEPASQFPPDAARSAAMHSIAEILQTLSVAAVMFAATNADDLVLLTILFAQPGCRPGQVVLGQLAGIGALIAISYTVAMLALAVPHAWIPWLGIVPVYLGIRWLSRQAENPAPPVAATAWWAVAGITMANGADNLGVYIPAFTLQSGGEKILTGAVFFALTIVWCAIARSATQHHALGPVLSRVCERTAPFILIGIGLWVIAHHRLFGLGLA
jgi:cadmium resistance protein CadD (predicted permease)